MLAPASAQELRDTLAESIRARALLVLDVIEVLDEVTARRRVPETKRVEVVVNTTEHGESLLILGHTHDSTARIEADDDHIQLWLLPAEPLSP